MPMSMHGVNIMDSRAMLRVDIEFYIGTILKSLQRILVPVACQQY